MPTRLNPQEISDAHYCFVNYIIMIQKCLRSWTSRRFRIYGSLKYSLIFTKEIPFRLEIKPTLRFWKVQILAPYNKLKLILLYDNSENRPICWNFWCSVVRSFTSQKYLTHRKVRLQKHKLAPSGNASLIPP